MSLKDDDRRRLDQASDTALEALASIKEHSKSCDMRQQSIERSLSNLEHAVDEIQGRSMRILWWAVGALLTGLMGLLAGHMPPIHIG